MPKLAVQNIKNNKSVYLPYLLASIFAIFTYFTFDILLHCGVIETVPKAGYAFMLIWIGFHLLGMILVPFLYYVNSFLIKRRKSELGLYSILGLEKKHIGMMMFWESLFMYVAVLVSAVVLGLLFSKLIFAALVSIAGLEVHTGLIFDPVTIRDVAIYYGFVMLLNLAVNLIQVGKAKPVELMSGSKKGEKEPKHIGLLSLVGLGMLGWGYYMALTSGVDSMIFISFFLAVAMVSGGTHFLFTSGSIAFLNFMKKRSETYYTPKNFIVVSGMLYRMKKNAASLANICIFSTMATITLICTIVVQTGLPGVISFRYPCDVETSFLSSTTEQMQAVRKEVEDLTAAEGIQITSYWNVSYYHLGVDKVDHQFLTRDWERMIDIADRYSVYLMTLEEYNRFEGTNESLSDGEVLVFTSGEDFGYDKIELAGKEYQVRELQQCKLGNKSALNTFEAFYVVVVPHEQEALIMAQAYGVEPEKSPMSLIRFSVDAKDSAYDAFYSKMEGKLSAMEGYAAAYNVREEGNEWSGMFGGLIFIGIFFSLIFLICLLVIMYYKQVAEGYEDRTNFDTMQKVGMGDEEIRSTIKRQVRLVFSAPLVCACLHTVAGMFMVTKLLAALGFFDVRLSAIVTASVCAGFALLYGICYKRTAKTYYKIVKQMQ